MTKPLIALLAAALVVGLAGNAAAQRVQPQEVNRAIDQVTDSAERFSEAARGERGYMGAARTAQRLSRDAEQVRRGIERRQPLTRVMEDFRQLHQDFQQLRSEFLRAYRMQPDPQLRRAYFNLVLAHEALVLALRVDPQRIERVRERWEQQDDWQQQPQW